MADYFDQYSAFVTCKNEGEAEHLRRAIELATDDKDIGPPENLKVEKICDEWGVWIHDEYGLHDEIPEVIQKHLEAQDRKDVIYISGGFGCSRPRIGEFGGWCCGISKDEVYWIDAYTQVREHFDR